MLLGALSVAFGRVVSVTRPDLGGSSKGERVKGAPALLVEPLELDLVHHQHKRRAWHPITCLRS